MIDKLNTELELGLKEADLNELTTCLQTLIRKPPKITKTTPNIIKQGEELEDIKQTDLHSLEKGLGIILSTETIKQIKDSKEYKTLSKIRESIIRGQMNQKDSDYNQMVQQKQNQLEKWQIGLIVLLVLKGLVIVGMATKLISKSSKNINITTW